jgi:transducin (beta)-like 1
LANNYKESLGECFVIETIIANKHVTSLQGHVGMTSLCSWNPCENILATGGSDSIVSLWNIATGGRQLLEHTMNSSKKYITALDWSADGNLLASASYDGSLKLWSRAGVLHVEVTGCTGPPICAAKFNKKTDALLTASFAGAVHVWAVPSGHLRHSYEALHSGQSLDVDWRNNTSFASCGSDGLIHVCKLGDIIPFHTFTGHKSSVNCIRWDPTATLLCSCSDDQSVKVWNLRQQNCVVSLEGHSLSVDTIDWNSMQNVSLVASASMDTTARVWDVEISRCLHVLTAHKGPVQSVAFSRKGDYLASVSLDKCLHIWDVKSGSIAKSFRAPSELLECEWRRDDVQLAVTSADGAVFLVDCRA